MKTKSIPAVIMLLAGFITCIIGIVQHMDTATFIKTLMIVLIIFYILGCVVKIILDKNFKEMEETEEELQEEGSAEEEPTEEQADSEEEKKSNSDGE